MKSKNNRDQYIVLNTLHVDSEYFHNHELKPMNYCYDISKMLGPTLKLSLFALNKLCLFDGR